MNKTPTLRYRCPLVDGPPPIGAILMGAGDRVRRGYRVLAAKRSKGTPALGVATWRLHVEPMGAERARQEIAEGTPYWTIEWTRRSRKLV